MRVVRWIAMTSLMLAATALSGCGDQETGGHVDRNAAPGSKVPGEDSAVKTNLAKLSQEDRELVEAQKLCPISGEPLGGMAVPVKVTIGDQPVFLCCKSCKTEAVGDADKTLAKVEELKKKNGTAK